MNPSDASQYPQYPAPLHAGQGPDQRSAQRAAQWPSAGSTPNLPPAGYREQQPRWATPPPYYQQPRPAAPANPPRRTKMESLDLIRRLKGWIVAGAIVAFGVIALLVRSNVTGVTAAAASDSSGGSQSPFSPPSSTQQQPSSGGYFGQGGGSNFGSGSLGGGSFGSSSVS